MWRVEIILESNIQNNPKTNWINMKILLNIVPVEYVKISEGTGHSVGSAVDTWIHLARHSQQIPASQYAYNSS